jgi:hypothetical protein
MISRNHTVEPEQPTRSAITVAGIFGLSFRNTRIFAQ